MSSGSAYTAICFLGTYGSLFALLMVAVLPAEKLRHLDVK